MDREHGGSWSRAELTGLFAEHFGDRLSSSEIERLAAMVADGLSDRAARTASRGEYVEAIHQHQSWN